MFSFANCIICKGSGAGLPVALVSDFTAGTVGSAVEQLITGGKADAASSIAGGLINAVSGAIYGNNPLGSLKEAFIKGAKAGAATSGINYLSEVFGGQDEDRRSGTLRGSLGLVPFGRTNDPRCGCMPHDPFGGMTEEVSDYGYRYQMSRSERTVRKAPERFSLAEFGREVVTGFVMGGLSSAAFYGAGRAVEAVKGSVRNGFEDGVRGRLIPGTEGVVTGGDSTKLGKNMMESMGLPRGTNWRGYQAQHIIPAEMANHPVLQKIGIDLDDASNGLFLRTPAADISAMSRHRGYHSTYNEFVRIQFDEMDFNQSINVLQNQVYNLQQNLKYLQQNGLPLYSSQGATLDLWLRSLRRIQ